MFYFFHIINIFNLSRVWFTNFINSFDEDFSIISKGNIPSIISLFKAKEFSFISSHMLRATIVQEP